MADLLSIRDILDGKIRKVFRKPFPKPQDGNRPANSEINPEKYPIGFCRQIRNLVITSIRANQENRELEGIRELREFCKRGGVFRPVAGIQHKKYFQNGVQAGAYWIDVANDTVDVNKPKVVYSWMETSGFQDASDPTLCAEVIEDYWGQEVFPNIYFPNLATLLPFFHVDSNGEITLAPSPATMIGRTILSDLRTTEDFLFSSRFAEKRLPREYVDLIGEHFPFTEEKPHRSFHRTGVSKEELVQVFAQHRAAIEDGSFKDMIPLTYEPVNTFNKLKLKPREKIVRKLQRATSF